MFLNYLLIALRQLTKNKLYASINIFGLACSTAVSVLMLLYAYKVLTYDSFHSNFSDIYFMYRDRPSTDGPLKVYDTWYPLLEETQNAFPEVIGGTRVIQGGNTWMQYGDKMFDEGFLWADSGFFDVFDFDFTAGSEATAMNGPYNIILSQPLATRLFGNEDPIGKTVKLFFDTDYTVTGVVGEFPPNSSITFNALVPLHHGIPFIREAGWGSSFTTTFVLTKPGTDAHALEAKFPVLMEKFVAPSERGNFRLLPMAGYNDEFTSQSKYAYMLLGIAFGILTLASINFTNLASAQSFGRAKEVGMRKALGASRTRIVSQFLSESMTLALVSLAAGLGIAQLLLPAFSNLVSMPLQLNLREEPVIPICLLGLGIFTGLLSGIYPALFASGFQPARVLKGLSAGRGRGTVLRNSLLTFQFAIAIFLISGVAVVLQQVNYMKSKDLNFEKDNVMVMRISPRDFADVDAANERIGSFKNEMTKIPSVISVSRSSGIPGNYSGSFSLFVAEGNETADPYDWRVARVDAGYFDTYGIEFTEGRNFIQDAQSDIDYGAIVNEATVRAIGWTSAVGKKLKFPGEEGFLEIVGVTKDFNYASAASAVEPVVHVYRGENNTRFPYLSLRLQPGSHEAAIQQVAQQWKAMNPDRAFEYFFPADRFNDLYNTEENIASIITVASVLAITIACLGLFALASFNMAQRQKEVAVRKVLGATVPQLAMMFIRKYLLMVIIALIIAVPATYYFGSDWLSAFAYRIKISPLIFIGAGSLCGLVALLTVGFKSLRTASANPVDSLKYE